MAFAEKLKEIRKQMGMSQEQLAEKLCVSRQAVTKWESGSGIPDVENMMAISGLFGVSIDELLSNEKVESKRLRFPFESVTEYDIDEEKRFDLNLGGAKKLVLNGYDGEKIRVRLASETLSTLQNDFKVRIDDVKKRLDVDVIRKNGVTEAATKEALYLFVSLPSAYLGKIEAKINAEEVEVRTLACENIELDAKTHRIDLDGVSGKVAINCNLDMEIVCRTLRGAVEINQLSATSRIFVPEEAVYSVSVKGIGTSVLCERDGVRSQPPVVPDADNVIELNGLKSELIICAFKS